VAAGVADGLRRLDPPTARAPTARRRSGAAAREGGGGCRARAVGGGRRGRWTPPARSARGSRPGGGGLDDGGDGWMTGWRRRGPARGLRRREGGRRRSEGEGGGAEEMEPPEACGVERVVGGLRSYREMIGRLTRARWSDERKGSHQAMTNQNFVTLNLLKQYSLRFLKHIVLDRFKKIKITVK
jgi:hypothetical protein